MEYLGGLKEHGIRQDYLTAWRKRWGGDADNDVKLTPLQSLVLSDPSVFTGPDLLVTGPPSSGKTFIAEALMAHAISHKSTAQCFYLVPLRALVTEKTEAFRPIFGATAVVPASSDYREFDQLIFNDQFSICVAVYEKFFGWLANPNLIAQLTQKCALIVIDELQMLEEPERGEKLDMILTLLRAQRKIGGSEPVSTMRFLGLAAQKEAVVPVQRWWGAHTQHIDCAHRPVPLFQGGVLHNRYLPLRSDDSADVPSLPSLDFKQLAQLDKHTRTRTIIKHLIEHYVKGEEQKVLVFVSSKKFSQELARYLASILDDSQAVAVTELAAFEDTHARHILAETLLSGVAFHHGHMTAEERQFVEQHFAASIGDKSLRVVVATPTLSMGVNLPADVVLIVGARKFEGTSLKDGLFPRVDDHTRPLTPIEYRNMAGRAGRYQHGLTAERYGISLLIQDGSTDQKTILQVLNAPCPPLRSALTQPTVGLEPYVLIALAWLSYRRRIERGDVVEVFHTTFAYTQFQESDAEEWIAQVLQALDHLIDRRFVNEKTLGLSGIGKEAAGAGISISTLEDLRTLLPYVPSLIATPFALLYALVGVEELQQLYPWGEDFFRDSSRCQFIGERIAQFVEALDLHPTGFADDLEAAKRGNPKVLLPLVRVLALWHWMEGTPAPKIDKTHCPGLTRGDLHWLGDRTAWLLEILSRMWVVDPANTASEIQTSYIQAEFEKLAQRVQYGVPEEVLTLAELRASGWHRERLAELAMKAGWNHKEPHLQESKLKKLPPQLVEKLDSLLEAMRRRGFLVRRSTVIKRQATLAAELGAQENKLDIDWPGFVATVYNASPDKIAELVEQILEMMPRINLNVRFEDGPLAESFVFAIKAGSGKRASFLLLPNNPAIISSWASTENELLASQPGLAHIGSTITPEALMQGCLEALLQPNLVSRLMSVLLGSCRTIITAEEMSLLLKVLPLQPWILVDAPLSDAALFTRKRYPRTLQTNDILANAKQHPEEVDQQILAARLLMKEGNLTEAQKFQERAIALDPANVELKTTLAKLLEYQGQTSQAEALLRKVGEEYPGSYLPFYRLGQQFIRQHQDKDAAVVLEGAAERAEALYIEHNISSSELNTVFVALAKLWLRLNDRMIAARWANKGLILCGEDPILRDFVLLSELTDDEWKGLELGKLALSLVAYPGKEQEALQAAERAIALYPKHWRGYDAKASVLKQLGRVDEALEVWIQMLETDVSGGNRQRVEKMLAAHASREEGLQPVDAQVTTQDLDSN